MLNSPCKDRIEASEALNELLENQKHMQARRRQRRCEQDSDDEQKKMETLEGLIAKVNDGDDRDELEDVLEHPEVLALGKDMFPESSPAKVKSRESQ